MTTITSKFRAVLITIDYNCLVGTGFVPSTGATSMGNPCAYAWPRSYTRAKLAASAVEDTSSRDLRVLRYQLLDTIHHQQEVVDATACCTQSRTWNDVSPSPPVVHHLTSLTLLEKANQLA